MGGTIDEEADEEADKEVGMSAAESRVHKSKNLTSGKLPQCG
jgi:hypothetical protein